MSSNWEQLEEFDTEFNADSVEWCPHAPNQSIFVCGTYQLQEEATTKARQDRIGQILLFSYTCQLECLQKISTFGILDQKWSLHQTDGKSILAVANAVGEIHLYLLNDYDRDKPFLVLLSSTKLESASHLDLLALSLDWFENKALIVSDSAGSISMYDLTETFHLIRYNSWKAHDYEAWICAFNSWDRNFVVTGGDDCKLLAFDIRTIERPILTSKAHTAGVTSLHFNRKSPNIFTSGSYDETINVWDFRVMKSSLGVIKTSGGVWRLKWDPFTNEQILAACMYGTFQVINTKENYRSLNIIGEYKKHSTICYGSDWSHQSIKLNESNYFSALVATCSFYDHLLNVSKLKFE